MQRTSYIQFISLALSTSQCWPISCRNCGYIVRILSCLPRWHRTVDRHQVDIVSTSYCLHHRHCRDCNVDQQRGEIVYILYAFLFTSSILYCWLTSSKHHIYTVSLLSSSMYTLKKYLQCTCKQCKLIIGSTSYTVRCRQRRQC